MPTGPSPSSFPAGSASSSGCTNAGGPTGCPSSWTARWWGSVVDKDYSDIEYRWHDAFHLSYAACLGWSPTFRTVIGRRRVSDPVVDQVEDGGRAKVIDEGIAALVFDYARRHHVLDEVAAVDDSLLTMIQSVTVGLEVVPAHRPNGSTPS